jgi:hypothetical protein
MAYKNDIPKASDVISISQADIQENFSQLDTVIKVDHEELGSADQGKHKYSTYPVQGSDPTTDSNSVALFCKNNGSANTLHLKPLDNGTAIDIGSYSDNGSKGHTVLPSGIIINWGKFTMNAGVGSTSITLSKAFTSIFSVTYGAYMNNSNGADVKNSTLSSYSGTSSINFSRYRSADSVTFNFIAIGK